MAITRYSRYVSSSRIRLSSPRIADGRDMTEVRDTPIKSQSLHAAMPDYPSPVSLRCSGGK